MIPRQQRPSRKPEPSAPMLPWMLRPSASQLSRRPRPPAPTPSRKPKPFALQPSGMPRPGEPPRLTHTTGRHAKTIKHLEEQVIQEEGKSQIDFLSACQAALQASPAELRGTLVASYHILMGQAPMSHPFTLSTRSLPYWATVCPSAPSSLAPEHSPRPTRWHPSPDPVDDMPLGGTHVQGNLRRAPQLQVVRGSTLVQGTTQSHSEAFSWDTSLVRETRKEYFKRHSPNFTTWMAHMICQRTSGIWVRLTGLLGLAIYEIQEVWKGPDELQQAYYALRSLPKGLKFLQAVPPSESPKVMGLVGIHDPDALCTASMAWLTAPGVGREPEWGDSHQPPSDCALQAQPGVQQMLQLPINLILHPLLPQLPELSTLREWRPQWVSLIRVTASRRHAELISPNQESEQRGQGELGFPWAAYWGHPHPSGTALEENQMEKVPPTNPQCPITCFPTHLDQAAACYSGITQDICQQCWTL